ncbi:Otopetrin-2 [Operophtera brumata]|uniref:Otopetrin-2 n=1 Tax=Operophtera brumata TaxID=104452 RepID=A0A0L7L2K4_OPEBR|nr:Otopetrin-2 [Operophtera brumata]
MFMIGSRIRLEFFAFRVRLLLVSHGAQHHHHLEPAGAADGQAAMKVYKHKIVARFGLMHMVGTNLSVWLNVLVQETKHEILTCLT